ncbi:MAG: trypsin-like peptidase domain-containing protein [Acidobacteriota bacterium]
MERLRILSGGREGDEVVLRGESLMVGRDRDAHLRLDPERDRASSKRHAELRRDSGGWVIRDLGSRNGTFVNDERITGSRRLAPGDTIRFGVGGPEARLETGGSLTQRVRIRTARATRRHRVLSAVLVLVAVGAIGALAVTQRERLGWERERARLHATVDSLLQQEDRTATELEGEVESLTDALERSRAEVDAIRDELSRQEAAGSGDDPEVDALRVELEQATQALARQQIAASLDFGQIEEANRPAVVLIFVEDASGRVVSGTGFVARDDALVVTARHLLEDDEGRRVARRVAIQFSDSRQVWPARIVAASPSDDLALLQATNIRGQVPTVQGINARPDTVRSGSPVAAIGFPLGGTSTAAEAAGGERQVARPLLSAGVVRDVTRSRLEIQGFGEPGASGSPVLDAAGEVVAVVVEGRRTARGGVLIAATSQRVQALLSAGAPEREDQASSPGS